MNERVGGVFLSSKARLNSQVHDLGRLISNDSKVIVGGFSKNFAEGTEMPICDTKNRLADYLDDYRAAKYGPVSLGHSGALDV